MDVLEKIIPSFVQYRISREKFAGLMKKWMLEEKGWDLHFKLDGEGPDDYGYLGHLYMTTMMSTPKSTLDAIEAYFGEYEDIMHDVLEEMFGIQLTHDYDPSADEVYLYLPYGKFLEKYF
jgi:hypothetical protein